MGGLAPQAVGEFILQAAQIPYDKSINELTKTERLSLARTLKRLPLNIDGLDKVERAIITAGGVCLTQINPRSMESKLRPGIFFAGEVLDFDALTGGFNLQIAFSTSVLAARNCVLEL